MERPRGSHLILLSKSLQHVLHSDVKLALHLDQSTQGAGPVRRNRLMFIRLNKVSKKAAGMYTRCGTLPLLQGLLEHTQQQAVHQGKGQRSVGVPTPRRGHPSFRAWTQPPTTVHSKHIHSSLQSTSTSDREGSGFCDVDFTRAAAIGGCGDDVLSGGLLIGRLLLQMFHLALGCALRSGLFSLQLSLTLGNNVDDMGACAGLTVTSVVPVPRDVGMLHSPLLLLLLLLLGAAGLQGVALS
ncbi:hypothetical protein EYF80_023171 [Liparis tanakae]|uniref:Uncharacterized protein n=1 Tax=Liparis tanakae TaxID=230148 RepID=A0A4Z2HLL1_9TELE|nr:hypothetical protein EYF80_023171 [Liparis tanakae]